MVKMKRGCSFNCAIIYFFLCIHFIVFTFAMHPMLYFNANDLSKLRHKAKTTHVKIAKIIEEAGKSLKEDPKAYLPPESFKSFGSRWNEIYGNNLGAFAMYCVLYPDDSKALTLVKTYMERMTSYPDWYVTGQRNDEVPVAHSLTGFATAFDFLYEKFSVSERKRYLKKIKAETANLHDLIRRKKGGWTRQHIHNHAPTNLLATLLGAMVYEVHYPEEALPWKNAAIELFEKAMFLFSFIIDGSCDEGVAYGSYTSRGITQYIYLALRHFGKDHTKNPWLKEHFWFYFATTMPGYQRSVGIADSNHNWFYGPESQLVFLDAFVMKNGYGNWLADRIRTAKPKNPPLARAGSQKWTTIHTEFIFYDASIKAVKPVLPSNSSLHTFSDWGVVTYGGGQYLKRGNTFLSFKSGALNGEAVADIVDHKLLSSFIAGWSNFNAGHEHPDQNSFVFAPNGRYFITEALYSIKFTYLNNALTFAPVDSKCNQPWEGQAGECSKWLAYKEISPVPRGRIATASASSDGFVYMAGDAANAYREELGLKSVQRSLLLLHSEVLLLLDTIILKPNSKLTRASAYFHNILHPFHPYRHAGNQGAQVIYPEGPYAFFWQQADGKSPTAQLQNQAHEAESKARTTNFVNVTFDLNIDQPTRIAFVFIGPNVRVSKLEFLTDTNSLYAHLKIGINDVKYDVTIASSTASVAQRMKLLGFGGYAMVQTDDTITRLGMQKPTSPINRCDVKNDDDVQKYVRSLITSADLKLDDVEKKEEITTTTSPPTYNIFSIIYLVIFALFCLKVFRQRSSPRWRAVLCMLLIWMIYTFFDQCWECPEVITEPSCTVRLPIDNLEFSHPPTVVIVSLPRSGGEVLQNIFENSTNFLYLSHKDVSIPIKGYDLTLHNSCYWPLGDAFAIATGWFRSLSTEPLLFLNNQPSNSRIEKVRQKYRQKEKSSRFVLGFTSGFWNSKLPWLENAIGSSMRTIVVVRDPRSWIYSLIRDDLPTGPRRRQELLITHFLNNETCPPPAMLPFEFRNFKGQTTVEKLAELWNANIATMIRNGRQLQIVRFEDLVANPEHASLSIMRSLRMTIALPELNRITRAVHSGRVSLSYEPNDYLSPSSIYNWKGKLSTSDVNTIEDVCGKMMKMTGYL